MSDWQDFGLDAAEQARLRAAYERSHPAPVPERLPDPVAVRVTVTLRRAA